MTDVYECEGQMSIYEFLDKEPEERKWNRIPDTFPKELGYRYDLQMKLVYADGLPFGKHGNVYAYGGKWKRDYFYSRVGCFTTDRRTKEISTPICYSPSYTADCTGNQQGFYQA